MQLSDGSLRSISGEVFTGRLGLAPLKRRALTGVFSDVHLMNAGEVRAVDRGLDLVGESTVRSQVGQWLGQHGLVVPNQITLLCCEGASFHHDGDGYEDSVFAIVWLCSDPTHCWDLVLPNVGRRVPLEHGTVAMFDAYQPHGVVKRGSSRFSSSDFSMEGFPALLLSYDLDLSDVGVARVMKVERWAEHCLDGLLASNDVVKPGVSDEQVDPCSGAWTLGQKNLPARTCR